MLEKIDKTINRELNRYNLKRATQAAYICQLADEIGKKYKFRSISFENSLLTIKVANNIIAQEVQFKNKEIIEQINKKINVQKIKKIIYRIE